MKDSSKKKMHRNNDAPQANVASEQRKTLSSSTTKTSNVSSSQISSIDVLNSVQYLRSCITLSNSIRTDVALLPHVRSLKDIAESSYISVEKISNFLKKDETNNLTGKLQYIPYIIWHDLFYYVFCLFVLWFLRLKHLSYSDCYNLINFVLLLHRIHEQHYLYLY